MNLGSIPIPAIPSAGTFPIGVGPGLYPPDFGSGVAIDPKIVTHTFEGTYKREQRFYVGPGARKFTVKKSILKRAEFDALRDFFASAKGIEYNFTYYAPNTEGGSTAYMCRFAEPVLSIEHLASQMGRAGITLIEDLNAPMSYTSAGSFTRIPSDTLSTALLDQAQQIIPLLRIKIANNNSDSVIPDILISDRCVVIDSETFVNRLADWGGISQSIESSADNAVFVLGNADDIVTQLLNAVDLYRATVEFSLFHVGTLIRLDLWAGYISDSPGWVIEKETVRISATDGAYSLASAYPVRKITRTCWKTQGDGRWCHAPKTPDCGKTWDGCLAPQGMAKYPKSEFGAIIANPESVKIKDNTTGVMGFGRSNFTSVSCINDDIYDRVVREVYTDMPMPVSCDVAAGREGGDFYAAIGIVSEGPIGGFSSDLTLHLLDNAPPFDPGKGLGLRYSIGMDGADNLFGIDNSPWTDDAESVPNYTYAAGTAWAQLRRTDAPGIQLASVTDRSMVTSVTEGMGGWVWTGSGDTGNDAPYTCTWTPGLTNPVWIAINGHLKALGIKIDPDRSAVWTIPPLSVNIGVTGGSRSAQLGSAANQAQVYLERNLAVWNALDPVNKTIANQTVAENNFTTIWNAFVAACNSIGSVGSSITDRQRGGKMDWYAGYYDPIANAFTMGGGTPGPGTSGNISASDMEAFCDVPRAVAAATNCDLWLQSLIDSGYWVYPDPDTGDPPVWTDTTPYEQQWVFRGCIQEEKPWRDWLQEILNTCLGYFYFDFNKLVIGLRRDASVETGFVPDNVLVDSVSLAMSAPTFNELTVNFGDPEFGWQLNNCNLYDLDAQLRVGSLGMRKQLKQNMTLVGGSSKSLAARFTTIRLREELGGLTQLELLRSRKVAIGTTILALNVTPGMVCSLSHPRCPDGVMTAYDGDGNPVYTDTPNYVKFRVLGWKLNKDYSISITGKTVTDSMYDLTVGPKASDTAPPSLPKPSKHRVAVTPGWLPFSNRPAPGDSASSTFSVIQQYGITRDGVQHATLAVTGIQPVNTYPVTTCPAIDSLAITTGGNLRGSTIYYVALAAYGADGFSWPSIISAIETPTGSGFKLLLRGITWPTGNYSMSLAFIHEDPRQLGLQVLDGGNDQYGATSLSFSGPTTRAGMNLPLLDSCLVRVKVKMVEHSGILGAPIATVDSNTSRITVPALITTGNYDYSGRTLSVLSRQDDLTSPLLNYTITAYEKTDGGLVLSGPSVALLHPGDVIVIRYKADHISGAEIGDSLTVNNVYPGGDSVNNCVGDICRIISGTGAGQRRTVLSNTGGAAIYTLDSPWDITPDATSIYIFESSTWQEKSDTPPIKNGVAWLETTLPVPVDNYWNQTVLVGGFVEINGQESDEPVIPLKECYIFGQPRKTRTVDADCTILPDDDMVLVDTTTGDVHVTMLDADVMLGRLVTIFKKSPDIHWVYIYDSDGTTEIGRLMNEGDSHDFRSATNV